MAGDILEQRCEKHKILLSYDDCSKCGGGGMIDSMDYTDDAEICFVCNGTGENPYPFCSWCVEERLDKEAHDGEEDGVGYEHR